MGQTQQKLKTIYDVEPPDYLMPCWAQIEETDEGFVSVSVELYIAAAASRRVRRALVMFIGNKADIPNEVIEEGLQEIGLDRKNLHRELAAITKVPGNTGAHSAYFREEWWPLLIKKLENRPSPGWFEQWMEGRV